MTMNNDLKVKSRPTKENGTALGETKGKKPLFAPSGESGIYFRMTNQQWLLGIRLTSPKTKRFGKPTSKVKLPSGNTNAPKDYLARPLD